MPPRFDARAEIQRLRWELAYIDLKLKRERLRLILRYDENQPRAPAGSPNGGQWVGTGGGAGGAGPGAPDQPTPQTTVRADGRRRAIRQSTDSDSSWLAVQETYRPDGSLAAQTVLNRDGSVIDSQFAPADSSLLWDSRHTIETADGRILTVQNAGPVQTLFDTNGQAISQSIWRADGPEPQDLVQPSFVPALVLAPAAAEATVELGAILFTWLAGQELLDQKPVIAFNAREYERDRPKELDMTYVGLRSFRDTKDACPKMEIVQDKANEAAIQANKGGPYKSASAYGTAVHKILKDDIDKLNDPKLFAEKSLLKSRADGTGRYAENGTIRVDVLEDTENDTVCVYDIKTGKTRLVFGRTAEIASHVFKFRNNANRIIVLEMRPAK